MNAHSSIHLRADRASLLDRISTPRAKFRVMVGFVVMAFLLGGGSRPDIASLVLLRPLACLCAIYALLVARVGDLRSMRVPLVLLLALLALMVAQLVPLPPSVWQGLPGRGLLAEVYAGAGLQLPWRPLAISPSRTLNSAMALLVPLAALLLFAVQHKDQRRRILPVMWGVALASVVLGVVQLAGPDRGPLYFYAITNNGLPVGLFANRNHQALMVCFAVLLSGYQIATSVRQASAHRTNGALQKMAAALAVLVCVPFLLIVGSRAGLLLGLAMIVAAALLVHLAKRSSTAPGRSVAQGRRSWLVVGEFALLLALLVLVFVTQSRSLALDRLLATGGELELRGQLWPVLAGLIEQNWLAGTGFGSFEFVYKQVEPLALLHPAYLNQAHNDWAQLVIEGGAPALAILTALLLWLALRLARLARSFTSGLEAEALVGMVIIGCCALASLADYPLRVPSLMVVFAIACGFVSAAAPRSGQRPSAKLVSPVSGPSANLGVPAP